MRRLFIYCILATAVLLTTATLHAEGCYIDPYSGQEFCPPPPSEPPCFDPNGDGVIDSADFFYLINFIYSGGPPPVGNGDANGDGDVDFADVVYLYNFLYSGGPPPIC